MTAARAGPPVFPGHNGPQPTVASSRSSFCSFTMPSSSRPDWTAVSHLFADALYELQVLNLDHASETTATDAAIQAALGEGLPHAAIPSILTDSTSASLFSAKVDSGLAYRTSIRSSISRARSCSRKDSSQKSGIETPKAPSLLSINTTTGRTSMSAPSSPGAGPSPDSLHEILSGLGFNRRSRNVDRRTQGSDQTATTDTADHRLSVIGESGDAASRPSSRLGRARSRERGRESVSRSRSRSRIRSQASSLFRKSVELARSNSVRPADKDKENVASDSPASDSGVRAAAPSQLLSSASGMGHFNPSMAEQPVRMRRQRLISVGRSVIMEENEEENADGEDVSPVALEAPSVTPGNSQPPPSPHLPAPPRRPSRMASLRQLFRLRSNGPASPKSSGDMSVPPSYRDGSSDGPNVHLAPSSQSLFSYGRSHPSHSRSQSQVTATSISPSIATSVSPSIAPSLTPTTMTTDTAGAPVSSPTRLRRTSKRHSRVRDLFQSSLLPVSARSSQVGSTDKTFVSEKDKKEMAIDSSKAKRRLSRIRSTLFERTRKEEPAAAMPRQTPFKSKSVSALLSPAPWRTSGMSSAIPPPVPPPPPISLSRPPNPPSPDPPLQVPPSALDPLSLLHVQHHAITNRFEKFAGQQRLSLVEYRTRAMKRVVHAHILARVPLSGELRRYERAERGYVEFCEKISRSGLVAAAKPKDGKLAETAGKNEIESNVRPVGAGQLRENGRMGASFDSGIAFVVEDGEAKTARNSVSDCETGLSVAAAESSRRVSAAVGRSPSVSAVIQPSSPTEMPPSPVPSPMCLAISADGTTAAESTSRTSMQPTSQTSTEPGMPISIPQPPPVPAHSAALARMTRLDNSMAAQTARLVDAFEMYHHKLDDLFNYRADRVIGRWQLESRLTLWRWLSAEREMRARMLGLNPADREAPITQDKIAHGVLAEPGIADRLDVTRADVLLGWSWRGL